MKYQATFFKTAPGIRGKNPLQSGALSAVVLALGALFVSNVFPGRSQDSDIRCEFNLRVPMSDGTELSTDVYRPDGPGRFPAILVRTPYMKGRGDYGSMGRWWASHGYALVVQDVRGRGDSDGAFYPLRNEAQDGYDAQTWVGTRPWSSGKVGTMGSSYVGWTQVYPAGLKNPHLAAMIPAATAPDPDRNFPIQFGVPMPAAAVWMASVDGRMRQDLSRLDLASAYAGLPLIDMDRRLCRTLPAWRDWLIHIADAGYWRQLAYQDRLANSDAPGLYISGWYDDVLVGTTENFIRLTCPERDPPVRARQRLLIGPWGHKINASTRLGAVDFGSEAVIDLDAERLRWFDRWLKGVQNGIDAEPRVKVFLMGANTWLAENDWPIARMRPVEYYFHSGGTANSLSGDGVLSPNLPCEEPPDSFRYDPSDPVPYITGLESSQVGGPDDYRTVEQRPDVLVYTSGPAENAYDICGPLRVKLFAASSARDTDWTVKVLDVHPDGFAQRLNDGIVRARYRHGTAREELLTPGRVEEYDIDVWSTCTRILKGHRLRVEISSSAFPKFDRNLNTGGPIGRESAGVVADQTVFHDRPRPSHLVVPVLPPRS